MRESNKFYPPIGWCIRGGMIAPVNMTPIGIFVIQEDLEENE